MDAKNSPPAPSVSSPLAPVGGLVLASDPIVFNTDRNSVKVTVRNTGDRPIQVGSHFHFFEVNRALEFDREAAFGKHLDIASTTAVRFEPGDEKEVSLVDFAGKMFINGFNGLVDSWAGGDAMSNYHPARTEAMRRAHELGFKDSAHE